MTSKLAWSLALWGAIALPALAAPRTFAFGPETAVAYKVSHPMHMTEGTSHTLVGALKLNDDESPKIELPMTLKIPVKSFLSGNKNRDRNMWNTMEVDRYPDVTLELTSVTWKSQQKDGDKREADGTATGRLTVHGVTTAVEVPVEGVLAGDTLTFSSHFTFKCTAHNIDRPALMFRPIDDDVVIDVKGVAKRSDH